MGHGKARYPAEECGGGELDTPQSSGTEVTELLPTSPPPPKDRTASQQQHHRWATKTNLTLSLWETFPSQEDTKNEHKGGRET